MSSCAASPAREPRPRVADGWPASGPRGLHGCVRGLLIDAGQDLGHDAGPGASGEQACIASCQWVGSTPGGGPATGPGAAGMPCSARQCASEPCSAVAGACVVGGGSGGVAPDEHAANSAAMVNTVAADRSRRTTRRTWPDGPTDAGPARRRRPHAPRRKPGRRLRRCRRGVWPRRRAPRICCGRVRR